MALKYNKKLIALRFPRICLIYALYMQSTRCNQQDAPYILWISMMKKRFQEYDLKWEEACDMAKNRNEWRKFVKQT